MIHIMCIIITMGTCLTMIKIGGGGLKWIKAIPLWMWPPYTFNIPPPLSKM